MLNEETTAHSNKYLPEQIEYLKATRPFIREVHLTDKENINADYFYTKDATASGIMRDYRVQFKSRLDGNNDACFKVLRQSGHDALAECNGFWYKGNKYSFNLLSDIYVERLGDGNIIGITREELEAVQNAYPEFLSEQITGVWQDKKIDSNGEHFAVPEYTAYISQKGIASILFLLTRNANAKIDEYFKQQGI